MDQQDKLEQNGQDTGIRKFREKVKEENGNKLVNDNLPTLLFGMAPPRCDIHKIFV